MMKVLPPIELGSDVTEKVSGYALPWTTRQGLVKIPRRAFGGTMDELKLLAGRVNRHPVHFQGHFGGSQTSPAETMLVLSVGEDIEHYLLHVSIALSVGPTEVSFSLPIGWNRSYCEASGKWERTTHQKYGFLDDVPAFAALERWSW